MPAIEDMNKARAAIEGVISVANSNFPDPTDIRISASGSNSAVVHIPSYMLRALIEASRG